MGTLQCQTSGDQFDVEVIVSGLGDASAPSLGEYELNVDFDASVLDFESVVFGDRVLGNKLKIGFLEPINSFTEGTGTVNLVEVSFGFDFTFLDNNQADEFTLATLTFNALASGSSNLDFSNVTLKLP